jgi:hypothetical protein
MNQIEREQIQRKMEAAFESGAIFDASEEELNRYLAVICSSSSGAVHELSIAVTRCSVLTTVKLFRYIDRLDKSNRRISYLMVALTILTLITAVLQVLSRTTK